MAHQYGRWQPQQVNEALIRGFVRDHAKEDVDLQFKSGQAIDPDGMGNKQKQRENLRDILARYACAFANTEGGLIVIGVGTDKDRKSRRDVATRWECTDKDLSAEGCLALLSGVAAPPFTSQLLSGAKADVFGDPMDPTRHGCWVLVPKSTLAAHRVVGGAEDGRYLTSTQEGIMVIPHDDLVRRLSGGGARLAITRARVLRGSHGQDASRGAHADFAVRLRVHNGGPGSATEPQVEAYVAAPTCASGAKAGFGPRHPPRQEWPGPADLGGYSVRRSPVADTLHEGSPTDFVHHVSMESGPNSPLNGQYVAAYRAKSREGLSDVVLFGFETLRIEDVNRGQWSEPVERQPLVQVTEEEIAQRVRFALWLPGGYPYGGEPWPDTP